MLLSTHMPVKAQELNASIGTMYLE